MKILINYVTSDDQIWHKMLGCRAHRYASAYQYIIFNKGLQQWVMNSEIRQSIN